MNKKTIRRCPWCGSEVEELGLRTQTKKKCHKCGGIYTYGSVSFCDSNLKCYLQIVLILLTVVCLYLNVYNHIFCAFIPIFIIIAYAIGYNSTYSRYEDQNKFLIKKYITRFIFQKSDYKKRNQKFLLRNNSIVPVCFVNDKGFPISNNICVCIEDARALKDNEYECIFSFLPLSQIKYEIKDFNLRFFFFDNYKKIGEGVVLKEKEGF